MRLALVLTVLALGRHATVSAAAPGLVEAGPSRPRAAKIDDARGVYRGRQYLQRRTGVAAAGQRHSPSAGAAAAAHSPASPGPHRSAVAGPRQGDGATAAAVRGNGTARFFDLSSIVNRLRVNWPSLLALGALVLGVIIVVPWVVAKLAHVGSPGYLNLGSYGRAEDGADAASPSLLTLLDESLKKYDVDSTACMQRGVCSYVRRAALNVLEGRAGSTDLILDGLASNSYVASWLDGTSILEASNAGRSGVNCAETYSNCSLSSNTVYRALLQNAGDTI